MSEQTALLIAAHGDRGGQGANRALAAHCRRLQKDGGHGFRLVVGGVLKGRPSLEGALEQVVESGARRLLVYPLFMADGYFTRKVLPRRVADALAALRAVLEVAYAPPLGADDALPALVAQRTLAAAEMAGYVPSRSRLLVVGHGSKIGPASAEATRKFAARLRPLVSFSQVETAFLEEEEFVGDALRRTACPTVVEGFFSGDGLHAGDDVPEALRKTGANAVYAGSIGADPRLSALISSAVRRLGDAVTA